ncbi:hypothetical protein LBW59_22080 [Ralstonia solanacearum]|uniref:Uncharacterized protein n=1 Tax=Ralstonia solanacearum TaxID=305 RepID=A0AAW5ZUH6_RALSL|nr:hypothetical protein [Ralstonia solanacearum]MDB0573441.1 hypothetical protein [Ralstonia solanacearum]
MAPLSAYVDLDLDHRAERLLTRKGVGWPWWFGLPEAVHGLHAIGFANASLQ